ncbi:MAG: pyrroline-5-carboxylate reductase [Deltaproteobacteria bacterium]|nr:pyrroline-5-carboxylate reductase [Deltaproteobacteria bacterium]MBW1913313.1 pyrroline-5-carboxylate reductase [Deltaproteobacteria bacterium]
MDNRIIGFIGAGNMATALIKGLISSGLYKTDQVKASDNDTDKTNTVSEQYGIESFSTNINLVRSSHVIVLAVKPQAMRDVLEEIKEVIQKDHLIISIAAGIPIKMIASVIGSNIPIIRVMPNTPALIQYGMSALSAGEKVSQEQMDQSIKIFEAVGEAVTVSEEMIDSVTAVSGSGPGFVFRIMEGFVNAAERLGFDKDTALKLITQTFIGSALLAERSEHSLARLREMVTSPGGTTAAGLNYFNDKGLEDVITGGIEAACNRSIELGKTIRT